MNAKTITVEAAELSGRLAFSRTVEGKKHAPALLREALEAVEASGGVIRYQTHGARSWAMYRVTPGAGEAIPDQSAAWPL